MEAIANIITGHDAIAYAETNGLTLNKYADPTEDAREGLSVGEARKVAAEDQRLIWVTRRARVTRTSMKNVDWNEHTLESALAVSPRACRVSDGSVRSEAPCGRSGFKTIIREYLREYDPGDDGNNGWCEGSVEIHGKRGLLDETRFWFRGTKRGELQFRLTVPFGQQRADGYTY